MISEEKMRISGKADMQKISALLNSGFTDYEIGKGTGIAKVGIGKYRNGKSDLIKMPVFNAIKLTEFAKENGF